MLASQEIQRLDAITPPFDPLEVLAWTHQERPHTRFLAWLLDPSAPRPGGGHGLGAVVLAAVVTRALRSIETLPGLAPAALPGALGRIDPATVTVLRELPLGDGVRTTARAPDVVCRWCDATGGQWVVIVENKIEAAEGEGQARDYLAWAARHHPDAHRLLLYVTPDGRSPPSVSAGDLAVPLTWSDVADAALDAIARAPLVGEPATRAFVTSVLDALRVRFGGRADVRALVEALHDAHPRAAALAASPATEPSLLEPLQRRFPNAWWHLKTLRPRAHRWTRPWADRVAEVFRELAPEAPRLVACAPHAGRPDMASWSIEGVTECLSLHAFCTPGTAFGSHRPRAWIGLRAPNLTARDVFEARDQLGAVEALPDATRAWLMDAVAVRETPAAWRWLCAGTPSVLARGYSLDDDARRVARSLHGQLAPHLDALVAFAKDPAQRLFSCDLDADFALPTDARDREALAREAAPGARAALIVTRQPTGHPYELRDACDLGTALGAAFGGGGALTYDYAPAASLGHGARPAVAVVSVGLFRGPDDASLRASVDVVREAVAAGALLLLCGDRGDLDLARAHLGALVEPLVGESYPVEFASGEAECVADDARFEAVLARDGKLVLGALCVAVSERATVAARVRVRRPLHLDAQLPLVAGWRAGAAHVVYCAGGLYGPWGRGTQQRPDGLARWWRALVAFGEAL